MLYMSKYIFSIVINTVASIRFRILSSSRFVDALEIEFSGSTNPDAQIYECVDES